MYRCAAEIDAKAAIESVSWGIGQVMGAHWAWLGYASVEALVAEAREGAGGQVRLMLKFIAKAGLAKALESRDWAAFARGYNGPAFAASGYHTKLAAACLRYSSLQRDPPSRGLGRGDKGKAVMHLQRRLTVAGYPVRIDGQFGAATEAALNRFRQASGLAPDGRFDDAAAAALEKSMPLGPGRAGLWTLIRRLLGFIVSLRALQKR